MTLNVKSMACPPDGVSLPDLLEFALTYDGYERLADADHIRQIVRPVLDALEHDRPPTWARLDLLRAALFYLQRNFHWTDDPTGELEAKMRILLSAIGDAADDRPLTVDYFPG
jgi:hypothetical protein